jgi:hypothetical protein
MSRLSFIYSVRSLVISFLDEIIRSMKLREHLLRRVVQATQGVLVQTLCNYMGTEYFCKFYAHHSSFFLYMIENAYR